MSNIIKNTITAVCCLCTLASCIDEYKIDIEEPDHETFIVEGDIQSNKMCNIYLSRVIKFDGTDKSDITPKNLSAYIEGSKGTIFRSSSYHSMYISIYVGQLDPEEEYTIKIITDNAVFKSQPIKPIMTDNDIDSISFTRDNENKTVDIRVTTKDPGHEVRYYKWDYVEDWEINAPLERTLYYDSKYNCICTYTGISLRRAFGHQQNHKSIVASNIDYEKGAIKNMKLYTIPRTSDRLQTLYRTIVKQVAISREEYEYIKACERFTDDMGGLFTPQPSLLPTNFRCVKYNGEEVEEGDKRSDIPRIAGIIGIRGNSSQYTFYLSSLQAGYINTHHFEIISDEKAQKEGYDWSDMNRKGYWVVDAQGNPLKATWAPSWAFDATSYVWGSTSLDMPSDWPNQ